MSCFPPGPPTFLTIIPAPAPPAPFAPHPPAPDPVGIADDDGGGGGGGGGGCPEKAASSLGTISMRKSKWSDLVRALAISARDKVRRLLESATMNARPVISAMNTRFHWSDLSLTGVLFNNTYFRKLCRTRWELNARG